MSFKDMKQLYYRSVVYQFVFFLYTLVMVKYLDNLLMRYASVIIAGINLYFIFNTISEYKKKEKLYIDKEQPN
jgi:hypothetical protein